MKSGYTPALTVDEIDTNNLKLQDMTIEHDHSQTIFETQEKQRRLLRKSSWKHAFHSNVNRNIWIVVLLIFIVGASIFGYIYHHTTVTVSTKIEKEDEVLQGPISIENDGSNESERIPRLRSYSNYENSRSPDILGQMYIYIRKSNDDGAQTPYERLSFPVARYNTRYFPLKGPFISLMRWVPIFADRYSKQTIINSRRGIYLLPSLISRSGKRFSVAELISAGFASLSSTGGRPSGYIDMASFFKPYPLMGSGIPRISSGSGGFIGGIYTNYDSFSIPRYKEILVGIDQLLESYEDEYEDNGIGEYQRQPQRTNYRRRVPPRSTTPNTRDTLTTAASAKPIGTLDNVAFFQASNSNNQLGTLTGRWMIYSGVDGLNQYIVYTNGTVVYKQAGIYFGMYAAQVGSPRGNGEGEVHIWSRRNGQDEPNSNSVQSVVRGGTSVIVYSAVFSAAVGSGASIVFSAIVTEQCASLGLIATNIASEPSVPSIISSEIQISTLEQPINYATLTSSVTQLGSSSPNAVTLNDVGDVSGVHIWNAKTTGVIKFTESKFYFAIASGQVGGINASSETQGFVRMWFALNGVGIPNSNTIQSVKSFTTTAVLVTQAIIKVKPGDELQIMFASTNSNLGMIAWQPTGEPVVPSMIFSTFALGINQNPFVYAQFSTLVSQWGCSIPSAVQLESNDGSEGITNNNDVIEFSEAGTYFLIAAAQVGSENEQGTGDLHLWMRLNGQDMANSNTIQTIVESETAVLVCQTVIRIESGDKLQLMFSTDVTKGKLGLVATEPPGEPWVPALIFSAFRSRF